MKILNSGESIAHLRVPALLCSVSWQTDLLAKLLLQSKLGQLAGDNATGCAGSGLSGCQCFVRWPVPKRTQGGTLHVARSAIGSFLVQREQYVLDLIVVGFLSSLK